MKITKLLMDMPVTVEVVDDNASQKDINGVFEYFSYVDNKFSTFKEDSEITKLNKGVIGADDISNDMKEVLSLCEITKQQTGGYFNILINGKLDPLGLVKGWSIYNAAKLLEKAGFKNFYVDAGGDIQVMGKNAQGKSWTVGIQNPFNTKEIVKVITIKNKGVATSGSYMRGGHVHNPHKNRLQKEVVSITVIGPNIYEADRFATAAFAMGRDGIAFIDKIAELEGYMIDKNGVATYTRGFYKYVFE